MTLEEFSDIFAMLAVQLRYTDADEIAIRAHYAALKDCDVELVRMAAQQMAQTAGEGWFPRTPEWRAVIHAIERQRVNAVSERVQARRKAGLPPLCAACDDTGFEAVNDPLCRFNRVRPCDCRRLRRDEVLGRRPLPELTEVPQEATTKVGVIDVVRRLSAGKRMP